MNFMSRSVQSEYSFLHLLYTTNDIQRIALIKSITAKQLQVLCEIVLNVYRRTVKITRYFVKKLVPFKREILTLINRTSSFSKKKIALVKLRSILQIILRPVLSLLNNGTGIGIDGKREIRCSDEIASNRQDQRE